MNQTTTRIEKEYLQKLQVLAQQQHRSMTKMLAYLIDKEIEDQNMIRTAKQIFSNETT